MIILLAPHKTEIKKEMLSDYQLNIADLYNILLGNVKKLVSNVFEKKIMCFILKIYNYT